MRKPHPDPRAQPDRKQSREAPDTAPSTSNTLRVAQARDRYCNVNMPFSAIDKPIILWEQDTGVFLVARSIWKFPVHSVVSRNNAKNRIKLDLCKWQAELPGICSANV